MTLQPADTAPLLAKLAAANSEYSAVYPGEPLDRQPVQTLYGGAHLFRRDSARRVGDLALASLRDYAPDAATFAQAIGLDARLASAVYTRVVNKLTTEPVEDFRIDFEDGYGVRPEAEEDAAAISAAAEVAAGMTEGTLPPLIGIRIKNFGAPTVARGVRTLDLFLTTLSARTGKRLPENFVVMLPKLVSAAQVTALVELFEKFEAGGAGLFPKGSLKMEFMVETTQSVIDSQGKCPLPEFVRAARGRCVSAALGVYDYTASCNITAQQQRIDHGACDFARHVMQVALGASGLYLSDGATNIMPAPPHKADDGTSLSPRQRDENRAAVHAAWRLNFNNVLRSLSHGWYQGWDLSPAQLPVRYAAVYAYFLEFLPEATRRVRNFVDKAARATLVGGAAGGVFDDAATAQGLLTFFIQGLRRRAITPEEVAATGLTADEIRGRSFVEIVGGRMKSAR